MGLIQLLFFKKKSRKTEAFFDNLSGLTFFLIPSRRSFLFLPLTTCSAAVRCTAHQFFLTFLNFLSQASESDLSHPELFYTRHLVQYKVISMYPNRCAWTKFRPKMRKIIVIKQARILSDLLTDSEVELRTTNIPSASQRNGIKSICPVKAN